MFSQLHSWDGGTISNPWDITKANFVGYSTLSLLTDELTGISFNTGGSKMTLTYARAGDTAIAQYDLKTPWTPIMTSLGGYSTKSLATYGFGDIRGHCTNSTGTLLYVNSITTPAAYKLDMSPAWATTSVSYSQNYYGIASAGSDPREIVFSVDGGSTDGSYMYVYSTPRTVSQFLLPKKWDVNSLTTSTSPLWSVFSQPVGFSDANSFFFTYNGSRLCFVAPVGNAMYIYNTVAYLWKAVSNNLTYSVFNTPLTAKNSLVTCIRDNSARTKAYASTQDGKLYQYAGDVNRQYSTSVPEATLAVSPTIPSIDKFSFSMNGTRLYIFYNKSLYQYNLSTAWDIASAVYIASRSVNDLDSNPVSATLSSDGKLMYVLGKAMLRVYQYNLSVAGDISTAAYFLPKFSLPVGSRGLKFSSDGTKMYTSSTTTGTIVQYSLGIPWELASAMPSTSLVVSDKDSFVSCLAFSSDGVNLYIVGDTNGKVHRYNLDTPWEVSSATYVSSFDYVKTHAVTTIRDIEFSLSGTQMILVGKAGTASVSGGLIWVYKL